MSTEPGAVRRIRPKCEVSVRRSPHTLPADDLRQHVASATCWCHPLQQPIRDLSGTEDGHLWVHHALDCREKLERQGIATGRLWLTVLVDEIIGIEVLLPVPWWQRWWRWFWR